MNEHIVKYSITDAAISKMSTEYMDLMVTDLDDAEQLQVVHDARMVIKGHRIAVEKKRKELKADALAWGKKVDGEAKRIFSLIEPIETHLKTEEEKVTLEKERIRKEAEEIERNRIQYRVDELMKYNCPMPFMEVACMTASEWILKHTEVQAVFNEEKDRKEQEAADLKIENERLEKIRTEQEEKAAKLQEQADIIEAKEAENKRKIDDANAKIEAEKKAIQDAKDKIAHEEAIRKATEQAKIKAEKDAEERHKRAAKEKAEQEEAVRAEAKRAEDLKPDKVKLVDWIESIPHSLKLETAETQLIADEISIKLNDVCRWAYSEIEKL